MENEPKVVVKTDALQKILDYLDTRPRGEVNQLVHGIIDDFKDFKAALEEVAKTANVTKEAVKKVSK